MRLNYVSRASAKAMNAAKNLGLGEGHYVFGSAHETADHQLSEQRLKSEIIGTHQGNCIIEFLQKRQKFSESYGAFSLIDGSPVLFARPSIESDCSEQSVEQSYTSHESASFIDKIGLDAYDSESTCRRIILVRSETVFSRQIEKLTSFSHPSLVRTIDFSLEPGSLWLTQPYLPGDSLREKMNDRASLRHFLSLGEALSQLQSLGWQHEDLKPENVLLCNNGPILVGTGYSGQLLQSDGDTVEVVVTSTAYNPLGKTNDMFAFGLMLWQAVTGILPTVVYRPNFNTDVGSQAGESLLSWISSHELKGNRNLSSLKHLCRPLTLVENCSADLEGALLSALNLELRRGKIELRSEPSTWQQLLKQLSLL